MAGPKYNKMRIRDEIDFESTGHIKDAASVSGTAGTITTLNATTGTITTLGTTTLTPTTVNATTVTMSGDLTRNSAKYISGTAAGAIPTGYTRCTKNMEIMDEGIALLSAASGQMTPKLATSPTAGKTLSLVYINSGNGDAYATKCSGNFKIATYGGTAQKSYATFTYPGDSLTVAGDGTFWYPTHPVSGAALAGPTWST